MIRHKHHIVPKHAGGSDDPSNIVELTVEEHAEAHKKLWEQYGRKEDWLAWQGLAGMIGRDEIIRETLKIGSSKAGKIGGKKSVDSGRILEMSKKGIEAFRKSFSTDEEYKEYFRMISKKQTGISKDTLKDWVWITDGISNKKIKKDEPIPQGYKKGRSKLWKTAFSTEKKEIVVCPKCNKEGGKPVMKRYHFENCKYKDGV